jgi:RecG-like helicase
LTDIEIFGHTKNMNSMIVRSFLVSFFVVVLTFFMQRTLQLENYFSDVGSISSFLVVFGTLYGIMTAFIVVEVWSQFNKASHLFLQEAEDLEKLYRIAFTFKDNVLNDKMKQVITNYGKILIASEFKHLVVGQKHDSEEKAFRQITHVIKDIEFEDDRKQVIFDHIVKHYGDLAQTRIERMHQSTLRLPMPLKLFFYGSTIMVLLTFIFLPFANIAYALFSSACLTFMLAMITQIIEGLDNPFVGFWKLTPKPFEEALLHIEGSY